MGAYRVTAHIWPGSPWSVPSWGITGHLIPIDSLERQAKNVLMFQWWRQGLQNPVS